tara:strand:+ start:595 stop:1011 length:417 start_codon:yes stop_codon:yes gene_type:complete
MRIFVLTIVCFLIVSVSFAQNKANMKVNSAKTVEFLAKNLKLDAKQKAVFMNAYGEYAANIMKAKRKAQDKLGKNVPGVLNKKDDLQGKKALTQYVMRFSTKRDEMVKKCLKKRQVEKYNDLIRNINPHTLEFKPVKK